MLIITMQYFRGSGGTVKILNYKNNKTWIPLAPKSGTMVCTCVSINRQRTLVALLMIRWNYITTYVAGFVKGSLIHASSFSYNFKETYIANCVCTFVSKLFKTNVFLVLAENCTTMFQSCRSKISKSLLQVSKHQVGSKWLYYLQTWHTSGRHDTWRSDVMKW